ncbi:hypothetical protein VNO77_04891 [Canavalia gladiata]|uniref:Uncharacterized protein n=1 Tax=Canavalia gladiata TaxID=3824 RepID=A0AAN9MXB3_CANGL
MGEGGIDLQVEEEKMEMLKTSYKEEVHKVEDICSLLDFARLLICTSSPEVISRRLMVRASGIFFSIRLMEESFSGMMDNGEEDHIKENET